MSYFGAKGLISHEITFELILLTDCLEFVREISAAFTKFNRITNDLWQLDKLLISSYICVTAILLI